MFRLVGDRRYVRSPDPEGNEFCIVRPKETLIR
jgi:hypothetical protein